MKSSLFAFALALSCSASAFAAPVKGTIEELALLKRATKERLGAMESDLNARIIREKNLTPASCEMTESLGSVDKTFFDLERIYSAINFAQDVWIDEGSQPVLMFQTNPGASRRGESNRIVRIVSNADQSTILSVSLEEAVVTEVLGGTISRPTYSLVPKSTIKRCLMKVATVQDSTQKSPVLK